MVETFHNVTAPNGVGGHMHGAKSPFSSTDYPSYPTRSLEFLQKLASEGDHEDSAPSEAQVKIKVVIVGAGLGGLACAIALARRGHTVTVLEQAAQLAEVGAGIQVPPNSSRLLHRWGLEPYLKAHVVQPEGMTFRRWEDGAAIGYTKLVPEFQENFKAPYYVVHRAHFHEALYRRAVDLGVDIKIDSRVDIYDLEAPSVQVANGKVYHADLIVSADGLNSTARRLILGGSDRQPKQTGFAVYRATVDVDKIQQVPELSWIINRPSLNIWIGEGRHVMTYTIAAGSSFNMVLSHVDDSDPATWKPEDAIKEMRAHFSGWDPHLTKIINMIDKTMKWQLLNGQRLKSWVAPSNKVLIIGDAAHAMVPYMSQGAAMAVEDGAALATILSLISTREEIALALNVFETERVQRSGQMQEASMLNGKLWHFADGPEQQLRDESMKPEVDGKSFSWSANQWSDPVTQWWAYGFDAEEEAERAWRQRVPAKD